MESEKKGSTISAIVWMFVISILLFWLPLIGPLIAGVVGGKKAGSVGSAMIAVFLPCVVFGALLFMAAATLSGIPIIGMVAGAGGLVLALVQVGPLLVGAIVGGVLA